MSDGVIAIREAEVIEPWDQMPNEPDDWYARFRVYLLSGPTRSLDSVAQELGFHTAHYFREVSRRWKWKNRAEDFDKRRVKDVLRTHEKVEEEYAEARQRAFSEGMALDVNRVHALSELAEKEIEVKHRLLDVMMRSLLQPSQGRSGPAPIGAPMSIVNQFKEIHKALADDLEAIAAETGGRVKRISVAQDLTAYAKELARSEGYDEVTAIRVAKLVAGEAS